MQIHAEQGVVVAAIQAVIQDVILPVRVLAPVLAKHVLTNAQVGVVENVITPAQAGAKELACTDAQGAVNQAALGVAQQVVRTLAKDSATILAPEHVKMGVAANVLQERIVAQLEQDIKSNF